MNRKLYRPLIIIDFSLILLIVLNFISNSLINGIITILVAFFLPGYYLVNILFEKKPEIPETLVLSIGGSIAIFILIAMYVNFAGMRISLGNILNPAIVFVLILGIFDLIRNLRVKR
jgi:uncharacterized membrane protein